MKKILRILFKFLLTIIGIVAVAFALCYFIYNEPLPEVQPSAEADMYANKMLNALHYESYKDTQYLEWSFRKGAHRYHWDKKNGKVKVLWDDHEVKLYLGKPEKSEVLKHGVAVNEEEKRNLIKKATSLFNNDSFWLVAPFKVFDKGTQRSIVIMKDGSRGLLVNYTAGGDTPGDSYLWKLAQDGTPISYQMWTKIIPIGGVEATWEKWTEMESGVLLPKSHDLGPLSLDMGAVKAYN